MSTCGPSTLPCATCPNRMPILTASKYCMDCTRKRIKRLTDYNKEQAWWSDLLSPKCRICKGQGCKIVLCGGVSDYCYMCRLANSLGSKSISNREQILIGLAKLHNKKIEVYPLDGTIQPDKDTTIEMYVPLKEYNLCIVTRYPNNAEMPD